ncbi:hypothetical protein [Acinetobacter pollinis]|uniref:hypothetical protein n=1 Tax=Acinetobacter pollinis TaxID=2605270 RepID=UPI0018A2D0DD|nr:hypothetical protein [Acinetobacter pollinis]MBF7690886.1 hypothetical protein [Acinetobacter pollinis]MBF7697364.1 hypothetical protein [Acinetobacter pollinis]
MSKQNIPQYDAGDLIDLVSLTLEQIEWLRVGLEDISKEVQKLKAELIKRDAGSKYFFYTLEKKLEINQYLLRHFENNYEYEMEQYTIEHNKNEGVA